MQRPTSVTVFGVLNIIFAVIGVIGLLGTIAMFAMTDVSGNPALDIMKENATYSAYMKVSIPLGLISSVVLLVAGIGLLRLKPWGRLLSLIYAVYAIVFGILGVVMSFIFIARPLIERAETTQGPEAAGAIGGAIGGTFGGCIGMVYPILLLIFMTRPKLVAAFQPASVPPLPPG